MMGGANYGKAIVAAPPDAHAALPRAWRAAEALRAALPAAARGALARHLVTEASLAATAKSL